MSAKKKWKGRVYLGRDEEGKQLFDWVGRFDTRRERDDAVARRRLELQQESIELPTCDAYVDRFLADYARRWKASSVDTMTQRLKRFREDFAGRALSIPRAEAKDWVTGEGVWAEREPIAASDPGAVVTLFNYAIDEDDLPLDKNPFRGLGKKVKGRADEPPPTEEEFAQLLDACSVLGADYAPTFRAFLEFTTFTLMRPSEVFALRWSWIDTDRNRILKKQRLYRGTFDVPKTGEKLIALTPPAREALLKLKRDSEFVFTSKLGKPLSQHTLYHYWREVKASAGLDFDPYLATKHYGVWYLWTKLNLPPRAIAAQAGWSIHSVEKLLGVYGHGSVGALDEVDRAFAENVIEFKPRAVGE